MSANQTGLPPQIETLTVTPGILRSLLAVASRNVFDWKPAPERWSISEVLAHLVDVEQRSLCLRARKIAEESNPTFPSYDQMAEYERGTYSGKNGREQLELFCQEREKNVSWLRQVPLEAWQRTGRHPEVGTIRLSQILNLWAFHDLGHIRQVAELYRAKVFWDGIGSLQRYYRANP
jgi:hypothetical protein